MSRARALLAGIALFAAPLSGCLAGAPSALAPTLRGSIGLPHRGVVTGAKALPKKGTGYERLRDDGVHWGTPALVGAIEHAAAEVQRQRPRTPALVVGDLSEQRGGRTERHRSHRTGRDVDLLFYVTTPSGRPTKSQGFVKLGADGLGEGKRGKGHVRFDVERNWLLVKALLTKPDVEVQWVFVARPLEALLVEHALARGEELELVWRAETVLRQPGDGLPHDDHFHVRLACSPDDAVAGCDGGPRWPWQRPLPALEATDAELLEALLGS